jgi:hypothetical protein
MRLLIRTLAIGALGWALLVQGCDKGKRESTIATSSRLQVSVQVPSWLNTQGWKVNVGMINSSALAKDNTSELEVLASENQLVWVTDQQNIPLLFGIKESNQQQITIDFLSTAVSLVILSPLIINDYMADPQGIKDRLALLKEVQDLAGLIQIKLGENIWAVAFNPALKQAIQEASKAAFLYLHPKSKQKVTITPSTQQSGLMVEKSGVSNGTVQIKVTNNKSRWVDAYLEGFSTEEVLDEKLIPSVTSELLSYNIQRYSDTILKIYGPGTQLPPDWASEPNRERTLLPAVATLVDNFAIPAARLIVGHKGLLESSGTGSVKRRLIELVYQGLGDTAKDYIKAGRPQFALFDITGPAIRSFIENRDDIFLHAISETGLDDVSGVAITLAGYFAPVAGQVYLDAQMATTTADALVTTYDLFVTSPLERFTVSNLAPEITVDASPSAGAPPLTVSFSASSSYPVDLYEWDFDGNGTYDWGSTSTGDTSYTYTETGTYNATLKCVDIDGATFTKSITITVAYTPASPTGLIAAAVSYSQINISWIDNSDNEVGFKIERSPDGANFTQIGAVGANVTSYSDAALSPATTYYYRVRAYNLTGDSGYSNAAWDTTSWKVLTIDSLNDVGRCTSIALDSANKVHISYVDDTNDDLKYATNASGTWQVTTIDSANNVGLYTSVALDSANKVHISYFDDTNDDLRYATNSSGTWQITLVDSTGVVGLYTSIAIDSNDKVHISYYDDTNDDLKYATNASGTWVTTTIDSTGTVGQYTSITLDSANNVHISYYDGTNADLKYATNASGTWVVTTIESANYAGQWSSIALDSADNVHISYYDSYPDDLEYITNVSGTWQPFTIDSSYDDVGSYSSIVLDSADKVHISYYHDWPEDNLKYATNVSGTWEITTIDSESWVGLWSSIALDSNNKVHISYWDEINNDLKYATNSPD